MENSDCLPSSKQPARSWKSVGVEAWRCDPWTICGVTVRGVKSFELWKDLEPKPAARVPTFDEAKARAKALEA